MLVRDEQFSREQESLVKRTLRSSEQINVDDLENSGLSQYNDVVHDVRISRSFKDKVKVSKVQTKRALTCAELREGMGINTTDEEPFHEAIKNLERYEKKYSL